MRSFCPQYKYASSRRETLKSSSRGNKTPLTRVRDPLQAHRLYFPTNYSALSPGGRDSPSLTRITGRRAAAGRRVRERVGGVGALVYSAINRGARFAKWNNGKPRRRVETTKGRRHGRRVGVRRDGWLRRRGGARAEGCDKLWPLFHPLSPSRVTTKHRTKEYHPRTLWRILRALARELYYPGGQSGTLRGHCAKTGGRAGGTLSSRCQTVCLCRAFARERRQDAYFPERSRGKSQRRGLIERSLDSVVPSSLGTSNSVLVTREWSGIVVNYQASGRLFHFNPSCRRYDRLVSLRHSFALSFAS